MFQNFRTLSFNTGAKFLGVLVVSVLMAATVSFAQPAPPVTFPDSPCDPKYYESLEARAWLEAQREITQNQNLIYKPDSVLEYTCYVGHLNVLAKLVDTENALFSGTKRWKTTPPGKMKDSLNNLVASAMKKYATNFPGTLLGGRSSTPGKLSGATVKPGDYSCDVMQKIWTEAKCKNFIDKSHDGFFTLEEYAKDPDKRQLPSPCTGTPPWTDNLNKAVKSPPWTAEDAKTYYDDLFPVSGCGTTARSHVETGLTVRQTLATVTEFQEHVCVVPGCRWKPTGPNAGQCGKPPKP